MSHTNDNPPLSLSAYMTCRFNADPEIYAVDGFDGVYAIRFGDHLSIHCTATQWDRIDTVVRNSLFGVLR